jgi:phage-related baseplate assembly protein
MPERWYATQMLSGPLVEVVEAAAYDEMVRRAETAEASRHVPMWVRDDLSARIAKLEAAAASSPPANTTDTPAVPASESPSQTQPTTDTHQPALEDSQDGAARSRSGPRSCRSRKASRQASAQDDRIRITTPAGTLTLPPGATINDAITALQRMAEQEPR